MGPTYHDHRRQYRHVIRDAIERCFCFVCGFVLSVCTNVSEHHDRCNTTWKECFLFFVMWSIACIKAKTMRYSTISKKRIIFPYIYNFWLNDSGAVSRSKICDMMWALQRHLSSYLRAASQLLLRLYRLRIEIKYVLFLCGDKSG